MLTETRDFTTEDLEYLRHDDRAMLLRLFRPAARGPHPVVVDLHGGAWTQGDMSQCDERGEALARAGIAAAGLDFRHAEDGYPTSLVDINYAVRWLKANAAELGLDAARVGLSGSSSGGHLAMLAAMRPADERYAAIPVPGANVDARVQAVAMLWPVINPLSRYRYAKRLRDSENPPAWPATIPDRHDIYWPDEAAMAEGNPMLALARGEAVATPPAVWIQGRPDPIHDYLDIESGQDLNEPDRFAQNYRKAGGEIEIVDIEQAERPAQSLAPLTDFFAKRLG